MKEHSKFLPQKELWDSINQNQRLLLITAPKEKFDEFADSLVSNLTQNIKEIRKYRNIAPKKPERQIVY